MEHNSFDSTFTVSSKKCAACSRVLSPENFNRRTVHADVLQSWCKTCKRMQKHDAVIWYGLETILDELARPVKDRAKWFTELAHNDDDRVWAQLKAYGYNRSTS